MLQRKASPSSEMLPPDTVRPDKPVRLAGADTIAVSGESPARLMQERLAIALSPRSDRWSPRRTLAFTVAFNLTAWTAILVCARSLL